MTYTLGLCYTFIMATDNIMHYNKHFQMERENMSDSFYKIIYKPGTGEIVEKKSRFISNVYNIENEEQVSSYINAIKKKYWDARHNCFAFVLGDNNEMQRCSDDGEPTGTAGKPILDVILRSEIHNCLIIVTRYFGGTLLGTGGLVRAYAQASKIGLENGTILEKKVGNILKIVTDYNGLGKVQYIAGQMNLNILEIEYSDIVSITLVISIYIIDKFEKEITELLAGKVVLENKGIQCFANDNQNFIKL